MAIKTVTALINGQSYNLTYNGANQKWEATITAPGKTSYNEPNHYFNVQITALNDAGTSGTADASNLEGLKFYVKERVKPVVSITSPSQGSFTNNDLQPIIGTVTDEAGGSGINPATLVVKVDNEVISDVKTSAITNGYQFTATPSKNYSNGKHTATVDVSDFDGNAASTASTTFTVDTVPPVLDISSPSDGFITNKADLSIIGTTNDSTSSPVTVKISLNGADQGAVTVGGDGGFTKQITLASGPNVIIVTATDASGQQSSITLNVTLDTSVPKITAASVTPNPADAGASVVISVTIE